MKLKELNPMARSIDQGASQESRIGEIYPRESMIDFSSFIICYTHSFMLASLTCTIVGMQPVSFQRTDRGSLPISASSPPL